MSHPLSAEALSASLKSQDPQEREAATLALYRARKWEWIPSVAESLRTNARERPDAPTLLVLAHDGGGATLALLRELMTGDSGKLTKLDLDSPAVPLEAAATVALSGLGDADANRALHQLATSDDLAIRRFLLEVIDDLNDPSVLHQLLDYLADERAVEGAGVPHGAEPARRLADLAADALMGRLNLSVGFARKPTGRYEPAELAEVERRVKESIPT